MKCAESWLRDWADPDISRDELSHELTMAGLEVEELLPVENSDDVVFDISITPNRSDCLSVHGIAREVSAITKTKLKEISIPEVKAVSKKHIEVQNKAESDCPRYLGRVIENVNVDIASPQWLIDRLEQCGVRAINPVVDVANYVMLEIGQPMHGFDLEKINQGIIIRTSKKGEKITLLDSSEVELDDKTLVIADHQQPVAIAGVMGGLDSGVTSLTKHILLESAFFSPKTVARQRQHYLIHSESAYRFERGVDPQIQRKAIERATQLILEICGGEPGEIIESVSEKNLPVPSTVTLTKSKLKRMLGTDIPDAEVENIFQRLSIAIKEIKKQGSTVESWTMISPSWRFDISIPEDLSEEVARLYGYNKIPINRFQSTLEVEVDHKGLNVLTLRQLLKNLGCHEVISYSFVDKQLQSLLDPEQTAIELINPISADMSVMRTNLWPGLVNTLLYNKSRQQDRLRLFEIGSAFLQQKNAELHQRPKLAVLIAGPGHPEQWGMEPSKVDFYDLKGIVQNLQRLASVDESFTFQPDSHPALHSGQTAGIYLKRQKIGIMGSLHPAVLEALDYSKDNSDRIFVLEMDLSVFLAPKIPRYKGFSKFPEIRRDLAILVNETVPFQSIQDTIVRNAGDWLKDVFIFDVYQGKGISPGLKSMAAALVFQHPDRTLLDEEVTPLLEGIITALKGELGATLRS